MASREIVTKQKKRSDSLFGVACKVHFGIWSPAPLAIGMEGEMILVDRPFISGLFRETVRKNNIPVIGTDIARELCPGGSNLIDENEAARRIGSSDVKLYTTSENAIGWIARNMAFTGLPDKIALFKDKVRFRRLIEPLYPDFYFREVQVGELGSLDMESVPMPFVIKPSVGFFSMGVHKVSTAEEWEAAREAITAELRSVEGLYPREVLDSASFIVEQCIEGDEFAIDAYFDAAGDPVIVGIYEHVFSSDADVSDRIYITSKDIIEDNLEQFSLFLREIGRLAGVKNFPVHAEVRRDEGGTVIPIEINPMRFGGWCTTADMTYLAYGFNPYIAYFSQESPDWNEILSDRDGKLYSIIILDNSTGIPGTEIGSFDYDLLLSRFENPLDLRRINYKEYPVFGFLFTETYEGNFSELERILKSDLTEFVGR